LHRRRGRRGDHPPRGLAPVAVGQLRAVMFMRTVLALLAAWISRLSARWPNQRG
jgi:hypothetical protein